MKPTITPEGREGIFLIEDTEAVRLVRALDQEEIHSFVDEDALFVGADWSKEDVIDFLGEAKRLAIIFPPNVTMNHQLVAITDDDRYAFDVGELSERDFVVAGGS